MNVKSNPYRVLLVSVVVVILATATLFGQAKRVARISQCAVKGVLFPAGANPARQLSLQSEALEAVQGGNELD